MMIRIDILPTCMTIALSQIRGPVWFWFPSSQMSRSEPLSCIFNYLKCIRVSSLLFDTLPLSLSLSLSLSSFPQIVMAIANADIANATLKERWTFATPTPLVARKMAALLQVNSFSKLVIIHRLQMDTTR